MVLFGGVNVGTATARRRVIRRRGLVASDIFELARLLELVLKEINALLKIGT